jgi:surfactin synthase thioesterase subunit
MVVEACTPGKVDMLGHSSGGSLAILFAAEHAKHVRRLVLVDVAGILRPEVLLRGQLHQALTPMREEVPGVTKAVQAVGGAMIQAVQALVPNAKAIAETGLLGHSPSVLAATALLDFNFGYAIELAKAPALILWGKDDQVAPPRIAHLLDDRLVHSELLFIADGGHVLMRDQPEPMASAALAFLDGPSQGPSKAQAAQPRPAKQVEGVCKDQDEVTLTGDFERIVVSHCKRLRLLDVRADSVRIDDSEGRIDNSEIRAGLRVAESSLSITGGSVSGEVAVDALDSKLDFAGAVIKGTKVAMRMDKKSALVASILRVESPLTNEILHAEFKPDETREF